MAEKGRDEIIAGIRSCLVSVKGKCDLKQINNDFHMLMGYRIPFAQFGYKNLEQFILSIPTLVIIRSGGQLLVDAKPTEKSSHISSLVNRQKSSVRNKKSRPLFRKMETSSFGNSQAITRWKPRNVNNKAYQSSPRPAAVAHNQFVKVSPQSPKQLSIQSRLTGRSGSVQESQLHSPPSESSIKLEQQEYETNKEYNSDSLPKKARKRITDKMASLNLNSNNFNSTEFDDVINWNSAMNQYMQVEPVPLEDFKNSKWDCSISNSNSGLERSVTQSSLLEPEFQYTGDFVVDLENFAKLHNLDEPYYITKARTIKVGKSKTTAFICVVKIGSLVSKSSYPEDFLEERSAKQLAAKLALEEISVKYKKQKLLISDNKDILQRIPPIVEKHFSGIWNTQLEADYEETFKEQLPVNWLEIIDTLSCITVLPLLDKKYVLRFCKPGEVFQKGASFTPLHSQISVPSNTVKFDDDSLLLAQITCVASAGEIWCRQICTSESEAFKDMLGKLEAYYIANCSNERVETVEIGGYYVASFENVWSRVRVFEMYGNDISCFCIDFGDEWIVQKSNIYSLCRNFAYIPAQAFVCRLTGIEELYEASKSSEYLNSLNDKYVQVRLDGSGEDSGHGSPSDPALSVVLYDVESKVVINEQLITAIGMELALPVLNKNSPTEVYVSYALDDGSVYIQVHSFGYDQLTTMLEELEQTMTDNKIDSLQRSFTPENSMDKLFFAHYDADGHWYRAKIIDWSPDKKHVQIFFVDYGNTSIIKLSDNVLYSLDELSDIISKYPYQAKRVRMAVSQIPANFADKVLRLMPIDQPVLVKVVKDDLEEPQVEFFKRSDNVLFSVNSALSAETEFKNSSGDGNNNTGKSQSTKLQRLISLNQFESMAKNVPSYGCLNCPPLPKIGNYLDVKIPFAVNPYNFFIQPYESHEKLKQLMIALQERYKNCDQSLLNIEDIQPGKIYASKHDDGVWYRTSVLKVIHQGSISVFYCDFGYYSNLNLKQVIPLDPEFMELPHQAIKAKLAGIEPVNSKWTMDDCKFFGKLVCKKSFVSILIAIETDDLYRYDTLLSLKLIDTSTSEDIHIDKVLVSEKIAKYIEN